MKKIEKFLIGKNFAIFIIEKRLLYLAHKKLIKYKRPKSHISSGLEISQKK